MESYYAQNGDTLIDHRVFVPIKKKTQLYLGVSGDKIDEWHIFKGKILVFVDKSKPTDWVIVRITSLKLFDDFGKMYDIYGELMLPNKTKRNAVDMYCSMYPNLKYHGALAIGFEIIMMCPK